VFGGRFIRAVGAILRGVKSFAFWTIPSLGIGLIIDRWTTVSARLQAIWTDLQAAWEAKSFTRFFQGSGVAQLRRDLEHGARSFSEMIRDWADPVTSSAFIPRADSPLARLMARQSEEARNMAAMGFFAPGENPTADAAARAHGKGSVQHVTVTGNPITVTVNVQTNANPQAIGDAAGNAVQSRLRGLLTDGASLTE
jgi:hypothetical protein